jgi:hypothetical protein
MFGEISNSHDFKDWMRCVAWDEERRNKQFVSTTFIHVSNMFQLDASSSAMKDKLKSKALDHENNKWVEIKSKIRIDHDLGQEKKTIVNVIWVVS